MRTKIKTITETQPKLTKLEADNTRSSERWTLGPGRRDARSDSITITIIITTIMITINIIIIVIITIVIILLFLLL